MIASKVTSQVWIHPILHEIYAVGLNTCCNPNIYESNTNIHLTPTTYKNNFPIPSYSIQHKSVQGKALHHRPSKIKAYNHNAFNIMF